MTAGGYAMDTKSLFKKTVNLVTLASFLVWNLSVAVPEGGSVAQGSATISQSGAQTTINQTSQNAVINWNSFNTASHEAVQFNQPNSSAVALNRINNGLPTQFAGQLNANGNVWILNPAGVLFTSTAKVDVAGLLATTHSISDADFIAGNYKFNLVPGSEAASIINNGLISAKDSGIIALVAPHVQNNGLIQVNLGKVSLSSGASYVLDMYGDQLINFGSNAPIQNGSVSNAGQIIANGGKVYMTANYASGVLDNMISMSGSIQAKSVGTNAKGEIVLFGGNPHTKKVAGVTKVSGKLDVSSDDGQIGGFIETSGHGVDLEGTDIQLGLGGTWLLDPDDISIVAGGSCANPSCSNPYTATGASTVGASFIQGILSTGANVVITASGNISIDTPLAIGGPYTTPGGPPPIQPSLTLNAGGDINIEQQITNANAGSHVYLYLNAGQSISTGSIHIDANIIMPNVGGFGGYLNFTAGTSGFIYVNTPFIQAGGVPLVNGLTAFGFIFNSPVILQQDATFDSSSSRSQFNSTVDGPFSLTINSSVGTIDFGGNVGVNTPLTSISVNNGGMRGTGGIRFITTGNQYYNPQVFSFGSNSFTFIGQNPGAVVTLNGGVHTNNSAGFVQVGDATYATNAIIRSSIFGFNPFPASSLTVYGTTVLDGATITTSGIQDYKGAVTVTTNNTILNSNGLVLFESTVDGPGSLTTNANNTQFNSVAAGGTQFSAFNINNTITLNGGSINQNAVTYNNPVIVTALNGAMNGAGLIRFNNSLTGPGVLTINNSLGSVEFAGAVVSLGGLSVTGLTSISTPTMQTINDQVYNSAVTLGGHSTIISTSGSIDFKNTVEGDTFGAWNFIVNAFNQVKFEGNVGFSNALRSLNVIANNGIIINPNILSNPLLYIITTNDQTYNGNIQLTTTYKAPGTVPSDILQSNSGSIYLNGPVSLIYPGGEVSLFLNAANNVYINNTISMNPSPGSPGEGGYLDVTAGNAIYINTNSIAVGSPGDGNTPVPILRSLEFHSPVLLQQNLIISSSSFGHVIIDSSIDTDPFAPTEYSLTMLTPTLVDVFGSMGANRPLASIDIQAAVLRFYSPFIPLSYVSTGDQSYSQSIFNSLFDAIYLTTPQATFSSLTNGLISIKGGLHAFLSPETILQINGNAYLQGNAFSTPNFFTNGSRFPITVTGNTTLDNAIIATKLGNQTYVGNVTVTNNGASLSTIAAVIEFGGNVNSAAGDNNASLSLSTSFGGYTQFDGIVNVGASTDPLVALNGSDLFVFNGSIFNVDNFAFASPIEITSLGGVVNSNTLVTFGNTIDGFASGNAGALTVNGNATINGTVGGVEPLFRLYVSGNTNLGANVNTYGDVEFGGPVTLTNDVVVTDTGTGIIFDSTIDSDATPRELTLNATAAGVSLKGDIGFNSSLSALTVFGQNYIEIVSVSHPTLFNIITTGNQSYTSPFFYINVYPALAINFEGAQVKLGAYTNASNPDTSLTITGNLLLEDNGIIGGNSTFFSNITVTGASILGTTPYSGTILINTISRTSGNSSQTYMGPITILENSVDMGALSVISGNTGTISYNSTIDGPGKLVTNASGAVNFGGAVGSTTALSEMQIFSPVIDITHPTQSTSFTTSGIMVLGNGAATDVLLDTLNSITFNASSLTLFAGMNSYSAVTPLPTAVTVVGQFILPPNGFSAPVGGKYLLPNYTNIKSIEVQGSSVIAENIITSDFQNYGSVGIAGDVTFTQLTPGYDITFSGLVDSALSWTANQQKSVVVNAVGNVNFQNGVGTPVIAGAANLINLDVTGAQITLNGPYFGTSGYQDYHSPVVLLGDVNAPGIIAGGNVIFENTVDGLFSLTILSNAMVKFDGNVGANAALDLLDVTGQQINFNAALTSVTSTGTQTYTGSGINSLMTIGADPLFTAPNFVIAIPVLINANTTYTSTAGNIDFQQAITGDGIASLTLNPVGGSAIFRNTVGTNIAPLGSLTVNGNSIFNQSSAQTVYTNGDQIYVGTSEMNNDLSLEALTTGRIVLGSDAAGFFDNPSNSYHLNAVTHNAAYGATGQGITGHVNVGSFTVGGEGGANVSPISKTSVVATGTGDVAFINWLINPQISNTYYCINGAAGCNPTPPVPPSTPFFNIPPVEIFNFHPPVNCAASGCSNVETMIDNLVEAGVVECGGMSGCAFGFATAEDTNGKVRILVPGSIVYVGDKIMKDKDACVCVKSLYKNEKACMGPKDQRAEFKA